MNAGSNVSFSVTASGNVTSYQWRKNGVDIAGATGASHTINPTAASDAGTYDVVVTNVAGSATSSAATLTVLSGVTSVVFEAHFEGGSDGFSYQDDQFGTIQPLYASGALVPGGFSGGGAQVLVGGINGYNVSNMSGGWNRSFALASAAPATVTFRYKLTGNGLDSGELGRMLVSIDGVLKGSDGSAPYQYRWQTANYEPGEHTVTALDMNAAYLSALKTHLPIGALEHHLRNREYPDQHRNQTQPPGETGHAEGETRGPGNWITPDHRQQHAPQSPSEHYAGYRHSRD